MKKLLCLVSALVLTLSLCACSKDDDSKSVKIPDKASSKASMTYEEAIVPFQVDETLEKVHERAQTILKHIECINAYYKDISWSYDSDGPDEISNENGIGDSMNALEEYFESEQQYIDYIKKISNPVIKDSYLKFIDLAQETYQKFVDNPTKSVTEEVSVSITTLELYLLNTDIYSDTSKADYYLQVYASRLFRNLSFVEAYCILTPEKFNKIQTSKELDEDEQRLIGVTGWCDNIFEQQSAEGIDLNYIITTLDSLIMLKDNAYAIAVKAYGSDSQKLAAYENFIKQATELYNKVRVNRPEFNDTEYIEKQEFDLDPLYKYVYSD